MRRAIHALYGKGLNFLLVFAQVLHFAVVDVVGPLAIGIDGQVAQRTIARGAVTGYKLGFFSPVYISHSQHAAISQHIWAGIFSHSTNVVTRDDGCVVDRSNSPGHTACRAVHPIGNGVFKRDVAIEIRGRCKDQLAIDQGDGTIADRYRAAFGNGLAVDSGNGEAIAIRIRVVAKHIDGDGAVLRHGELVVTWQGRSIHHAIVGPLGRGVAHRVGQGGIHGDGAVDRQIRGGDSQGDLGAADVVGCQNSAGVRHAITIPVHIETIACLGIPWQPDNDTHPSFTLVRGDDIICPIQDFDLWSGGSGTINAAIVGCRSCIPRRIGDTGCDGIRTLGQGSDHIHCEGTAGCNDSV